MQNPGLISPVLSQPHYSVHPGPGSEHACVAKPCLLADCVANCCIMCLAMQVWLSNMLDKALLCSALRHCSISCATGVKVSISLAGTYVKTCTCQSTACQLNRLQQHPVCLRPASALAELEVICTCPSVIHDWRYAISMQSISSSTQEPQQALQLLQITHIPILQPWHATLPVLTAARMLSGFYGKGIRYCKNINLSC